MGTGNITEQGT